MNIVLISHEYPPYAFGGVAVYVESIAKEMARLGMTITVLAGKPWHSTIPADDGPTVIRLPIPNVPPRHFWFQVLNSPKIMELIKDADLVHVQACASSLLLRRIKERCGVPIVLTSHGSYKEIMRACAALGQPSLSYAMKDWFHSYYSLRFHYYLHGLDMQYADRVICVSHHLKNELTRDYSLHDSERRLSVVPPIAEPPAGIAQNPDKRNGKKVRIIYVGRLYTVKGAHVLADAMKILLCDQKRNDITLDIVGSGPLDQFLRSYVARNKLQEYVKMIGHVDRAEALARVRASDVFVLPSLYEANPIALLEAFWLGKPALVFDLPWAREFIEGLPGVVGVRPVDAGSLAEAILDMTRSIRTAELGVRDKDQSSIREKYSAASVTRQILSIYEQVSNRA